MFDVEDEDQKGGIPRLSYTHPSPPTISTPTTPTSRVSTDIVTASATVKFSYVLKLGGSRTVPSDGYHHEASIRRTATHRGTA